MQLHAGSCVHWVSILFRSHNTKVVDFRTGLQFHPRKGIDQVQLLRARGLDHTPKPKAITAFQGFYIIIYCAGRGGGGVVSMTTYNHSIVAMIH